MCMCVARVHVCASGTSVKAERKSFLPSISVGLDHMLGLYILAHNPSLLIGLSPVSLPSPFSSPLLSLPLPIQARTASSCESSWHGRRVPTTRVRSACAGSQHTGGGRGHRVEVRGQRSEGEPLHM